MSRHTETDAEVIASLGLGGFLRRPRPAPQPAYRIRWTDSDNLHGREALVIGGGCDGLRVVVRKQGNQYRYPDVFDLTAYTFDPTDWVWRLTR